MTRPSIGLVMVIADSWPMRDLGTITCAPLVMRSNGFALGSSSRLSRSLQGPVAFTTTLAWMVPVSPFRTSHFGAVNHAARLLEGVYSHVVRDPGAVAHRRADCGKHEASVVTLGVVVASRAYQAPLPQGRFGGEQGALAEDADGPHIAEECEEGVEAHPGRELPEGHPVTLVHRKDERQGAD
jgi:hypothetical protein